MNWLPKKTVLVPIDFSEPSLEAVRLGRSMVEDVSGLHVLYVLQPISVLEPGVTWGTVTDETREENVLKSMHEKLDDPELEGAAFKALHGSPGIEIADYAEKIHADLIVIPSHGYGSFKRLLLGSVADRVLHHAPCPVLVLRRNSAE